MNEHGPKLMVGGQVVDLGNGYGQIKTIVSIAGWQREVFSPNNLASAAYTKSAWANRCVSIRSSALAKIPWEIVGPDDEVIENGPIEAMFKRSRLGNLMRLAEIDNLLFGHALWIKDMAGEEVASLRRQNGGTVKTERGPDGLMHVFIDMPGKTREEVFIPDDAAFFHEFSPDNDMDGIPVVKVAEPSIEAEYNANRYVSAFFENSAIPAIVFSTEQTVQDADMKKLRRWWDRLFQGPDKAHKTGFVDRGLKPEVLGFSPDKLALSEIRANALAEICVAFGVPPVLMGVEAANYATADEQRQSLYEETIIPRAQWYEEQINSQIVEAMDPNSRFRFRVEDLPTQQEDENIKAERMASLVNAGIITAEAAATELGYSPEETGTGPQAPQQFGGFGATQAAPVVERPAPVMERPAEVVEAKSRDLAFLALRAWRKKARKRPGKSVEFVSEHIGNSVKSAVLGQLEHAETIRDVDRIFDQAERWLNY